MPTKTATPRRFDLDWLRVLSILMIFGFHSLRFFDQSYWHVKNAVTYPGVDIVIAFLSSWGMPLIFVISGASIYYSLGTRGAGRFLKERGLRLLVPLIVGIFTHVMLQVYLERMSHHQFYGTFWQFVPQYFNGLYTDGGNFAWMGLHLWYLLILFVLSVLLLPLLRWLKHSPMGQRVLRGLNDGLAKPLAVYLLALPIMLVANLFDPRTLLGVLNFGGWCVPAYLCFTLYGFLIIGHDGVQAAIQRQRWLSLIGGVLIVVVQMILRLDQPDPIFGTLRYTLLTAILGLSTWLWIMTLLGFGLKHLNFYSARMEYLNEAVLPFYVLHQSVLIVVGYFVLQWDIPDLLKWFVITPTSFVIIIGAYEWLIRRSNVLRVLFGLKPRQPAAQPRPVPQIA